MLPLELQADLDDYQDSITTGIHYDRGHLAPAKAFLRNEEAMKTSHIYSNGVPQTEKLNSGRWKTLEREVYNYVKNTGNAWVVTGVVCLDDDSTLVSPQYRIGNHQIAVPTHCYKVILCENDQGDFTMYGFMLPNQTDPILKRSPDYQLTVDRLEEITGYDFFSELDDVLEDSLEAVISPGWLD